MSNPGEKRVAERFPVNPGSACVFASPVLEDFGPVKLVNVSLNGVGFISMEKLHDNLMMAIKLENSTKKFAKTMLVRIVHVTPQASGTYLVGGVFDTALTYDELCNFVLSAGMRSAFTLLPGLRS